MAQPVGEFGERRPNPLGDQLLRSAVARRRPRRRKQHVVGDRASKVILNLLDGAGDSDERWDAPLRNLRPVALGEAGEYSGQSGEPVQVRRSMLARGVHDRDGLEDQSAG